MANNDLRQTRRLVIASNGIRRMLDEIDDASAQMAATLRRRIKPTTTAGRASLIVEEEHPKYIRRIQRTYKVGLTAIYIASIDFTSKQAVNAYPIGVWIVRGIPKLQRERSGLNEVVQASQLSQIRRKPTYVRPKTQTIGGKVPRVSAEEIELAYPGYDRIINGQVSVGEAKEIIRKSEFPAPTQEEITLAVNRTNDPDGVSAIDRIVTISEEDKGKYQSELVDILSATQVADKEADVVRLLNKATRKYVGNVRYKAQRIARTEGVRVSQDALERTWESVPDLFSGYLWHSALLPQTRQDHASREGTRYIRAGEGNYVAENGPHEGEVFPGIPLAPNCLCWDEPILHDEPEGIDYGTYNQAQARARAEIEAQSKTDAGEEVPKKTQKAAKKKVTPKKKAEPKTVQPLAPKEPAFVPAKTTKEAEQWAVERGVAKKADYSKTTTEVANTINNVLNENITQHGITLEEIAPKSTRKKKDRRLLFSVEATQEFRSDVVKQTFFYSSKNAKSEQSIKAMLSEFDKQGLIKNMNIRGSVTHEAGHILDKGINVRDFESLGNDMQKALKKKWKEQKAFDGDLELNRNIYRKELKEIAGDYARTNDAEEFAELYRLHREGKIPRKLSYVDDIFKELLQ